VRPLRQGAPPPIPQDARKPSQQAVDTAQRSALEFMQPLIEATGELALVAKKARDDFHAHRGRVLELARQIKTFADKNPKGFENAMTLLKTGGEAWLALDKALIDQVPTIYNSFNQLYQTLNTFAKNVQPAQKLSPEKLMGNPSLEEMQGFIRMMGKKEGLSDEEIDNYLNSIGDDTETLKKLTMGALTAPRFVRVRGRLYRRASLLEELA
jgi:hypothetical protein